MEAFPFGEPLAGPAASRPIRSEARALSPWRQECDEEVLALSGRSEIGRPDPTHFHLRLVDAPSARKLGEVASETVPAPPGADVHGLAERRGVARLTDRCLRIDME